MRAKTWKALIVAALAVVILTAAVGGTMAWLSTQTQDLTNTFVPAKVTCKVVENFTEGDTEKKDVRIQNTGTTDAYIRVAVIGNWYKDGKVVAGWTDDITYNETDWFTKSENGVTYHYYKYSIPSVAQNATGCFTAKLFNSYTPTGGPEGAHFEMNIICQAVQSTPAAAVQDAWGVTVGADGTISKN